MRKMRENLKNRRNPSHQISENFGKSRNFIIFWYFGFIKVYFVFWYFACISYFNFWNFQDSAPRSPGRGRGFRGRLSFRALLWLQCSLFRWGEGVQDIPRYRDTAKIYNFFSIFLNFSQISKIILQIWFSSSNYLHFPAIPAKFFKIFNEKW